MFEEPIEDVQKTGFGVAFCEAVAVARKIAFFEIAGLIAVVIAVVTFIQSAQRQSRIEADQHRQKLHQAWQTISLANTTTGDGGRRIALEDLVQEGQQLRQVVVAGAVLPMINLSSPDPDSRSDLTFSVFAASDLSGADLGKANLRGAVFEEVELVRANLFDVFAESVHFTSSKLIDADLRHGRFDRAVFDAVDFTHAQLSGASFRRAVFSGDSNLTIASAVRTDFAGGQMTGTNFEAANLLRANFEGTILTASNFHASVIDRTDFFLATLTDADLSGVFARNATLTSIEAPDSVLEGGIFHRANLSGAVLERGDLDGACFRDAQLRSASLRSTSLVGASFREADLQGVSLEGANLQSANFTLADLRNVDLEGVTNWKSASFEYANISNVRNPPDGFRVTVKSGVWPA